MVPDFFDIPGRYAPAPVGLPGQSPFYFLPIPSQLAPGPGVHFIAPCCFYAQECQPRGIVSFPCLFCGVRAGLYGHRNKPDAKARALSEPSLVFGHRHFVFIAGFCRDREHDVNPMAG